MFKKVGIRNLSSYVSDNKELVIMIENEIHPEGGKLSPGYISLTIMPEGVKTYSFVVKCDDFASFVKSLYPYPNF